MAQQNKLCPSHSYVADPGGVLPPSEDVSLGNGSVAENGLEVLELTEQPSFYSHVRVWSAEGASFGSPQNRFYLDLAGQCILPPLCFALQSQFANAL